jgi:hypothetical protein
MREKIVRRSEVPFTKVNLDGRVGDAQGHEAARANGGTEKSQIATPRTWIGRTDTDNTN